MEIQQHLGCLLSAYSISPHCSFVGETLKGRLIGYCNHPKRCEARDVVTLQHCAARSCSERYARDVLDM